MTTTEKTPQEIAITAAEKELHEIEAMENHFSLLNMEKNANILRKIINEKAAVLLELRHHFDPPETNNVREEYEKQLEDEIRELKKKIEKLETQLSLIEKMQKVSEGQINQ